MKEDNQGSLIAVAVTAWLVLLPLYFIILVCIQVPALTAIKKPTIAGLI